MFSDSEFVQLQWIHISLFINTKIFAQNERNYESGHQPVQTEYFIIKQNSAPIEWAEKKLVKSTNHFKSFQFDFTCEYSN